MHYFCYKVSANIKSINAYRTDSPEENETRRKKNSLLDVIPSNKT